MEPITNVVAQTGISLLELFGRLNLYILIPLFLAVFGFVISYFKNYQWPAQGLREQLVQLIRQIKAARTERELSLDALENKLDYIFEMSPFSHLWAEYRQSLHTVHAQDYAGIKVIHATVPAETFFSKESLIDLQINADFYRHLPGILTGIGIIGTFSGLVWGLHEFKPDPGQALDSLPLLLQEVTSAFIGSGLAILAAIFITYKEKSILNQCYRLVEELNKEIDSLHAMGAGEEYLARLVRALESSPAETRGLKDTLLEDLSKVMYDVAERQSNAQQEQHRLLSSQISEAIKTALAEPMAQLSGVVQNVTAGQNEAVGGMLESLLAGFLARFGDAFGQQIEGINSSLQSSTKTLDMVQDAMTRSIGDISNAGMTAADKMSDKLEDSLSRALLQQQQMSMQLLKQQQHSTDIMDRAIDGISGKLEDALSKVVSAQEQINVQALQQQKQSTDITDRAIDRISVKLEDALSKTVAAQEQIAVQALQQQKQSMDITERAVDRIAVKLEDAVCKVISAQEQINIHALQQQKQSTDITDRVIDRLSVRLEDSLSRTSSIQEQINNQVMQQQRQSLDAVDRAIDQISVKFEDTMSRVTSAQEQLNAQTFQQQKQSTDVADRAIEKISGRLEDSLSNIVSIQEKINTQALQQQRQSLEATDALIRGVLEKMQGALGDIALDRSRQMEQDQKRHDLLLTSAQTLYADLSGNVGRLVENIQETTSKTEENLASIQHTTLHAISGMKDGAAVMLQAADRFTVAGDSISGLTGAMAEAASTMQMTAGSMQQSFEAYDGMRESVQQHVLQLQELMDIVKRETGVNHELVSDMERIVGSLADVERQSKEYLDRVSEVLKRSFQEFGIEMVGQVRNVSAESNRQLGSSLQALSSTVDSMIASVTKLRRVG